MTKMSWRQEDMDAVLRRIRYNELSIRAAAKVYQVPETTLRRKYHGKSPQVARMGPPPILTSAEEKRIVDWAIHMARIGFGLSKDDIQNVVKNMIETDGRENPFVDNRPGRKWWKNFSKRHPNLVYRRPQPIGKERAVVSSDRLNKWFRDFESYLTEHDALSILEEPSRIFNADESGFAIGGRLSDRVLAERGEKYVHEFKNTDKSQITVMVTAGATGCLLPPLIILPGKHRIADLKTYEGAPKGAYFARTSNGWMDGKAFFSYVAKLFHPFVVQKKLPLPVLLLVDGLSAHQTIEVAEYCRQNKILLYRLPPNSTHVLQPCDVSIFKSLKNSWNNAEKDYRAEHPGDYVTRTTFANVFRKAWEELKSKPEVVRNGFKATGLYPFSKSYNKSMVRPAALYQFWSSHEELHPSGEQPSASLHSSGRQPSTSPHSSRGHSSVSLPSSDRQPSTSLHSSDRQLSTSLLSGEQLSTSLRSSVRQPSTSLPSSDRQMSISLHSSNRQPSTSLHSSNRQPSTSLHSSGRQPSISLHPSDRQPSTSLPWSDRQPSTSLQSSDRQPSTSLYLFNREPSTCTSPSTTPFLSSQRSNERPAAVRRLVWPSTQSLPSRIHQAQCSHRPLNEDFVSPALEYYTRYPVVEVSTNRRRKPNLPEAISGEEFLRYAKAKQNQKRQDEERKQKRREEREQKREKREQEKEVKRMRREERERKRERREQEKEMKRMRRVELEQKKEKIEREKEMKRRMRERQETMKKNKQRKEEVGKAKNMKKGQQVQQEKQRKRRLEFGQTNMTKRRKQEHDQ